ncbi:hypothetical protein [Massilia sp. X63]|uniref:hypothetical protein n=1 Tax=Massilia sp. X63 TaxID=3237285 RepID=UPI0034DDBDB4
MGQNNRNYDNDECFELPIEAYRNESTKIEIDDHWLKSAPPHLQKQAMQEWFLSRYCDPAIETPYMSSEGGYIFVHGGPYDPDEVIQDRFHNSVPYRVMKSLINDLIDKTGSEWAPRDWEDDYFDALDVYVKNSKEPRNVLETRLDQIIEILSVQGTPQALTLLEQLSFSSAITAFESYLWETMSYAVESDPKSLQDIVTKHKAFSEQPMLLGDIYKKLDSIKDMVKAYLQNLVWHRFDVVAPLMAHGLRVKLPSFKPFIDAVIKRHDIVHRSGFSKTGEPITVSRAEIKTLIGTIRAFADELEHALSVRNYEDMYGTERFSSSDSQDLDDIPF